MRNDGEKKIMSSAKKCTKSSSCCSISACEKSLSASKLLIKDEWFICENTCSEQENPKLKRVGDYQLFVQGLDIYMHCVCVFCCHMKGLPPHKADQWLMINYLFKTLEKIRERVHRCELLQEHTQEAESSNQMKN